MAPAPTLLAVAALVVLSVLGHAAAKGLPSYVPICKRNDPQLSECIRKATITLQPYISRGIPELNIPSVSPLVVPMVKLEQGTAAVNYKIKLTNLKIYGLGDYKFQSVGFNENDLKITGKVDIPDLFLEGDYVMDGRALLVPIRGNGVFTANLTSTSAAVEMQAALHKRKSGEYLRVIETKVDLTIPGAKASFSNLFNGDPILSATTNRFLSENSLEIVKEVKPAVEAVAAMIVEDIANNFARSATYNKLLPPK